MSKPLFLVLFSCGSFLEQVAEQGVTRDAWRSDRSMAAGSGGAGP
jgi:hypothetical protein